MVQKVVIFGSTGMTGLCALEAAVNKGLQVRAFVRDPAKVPEHLKDKVEIFKGNILDMEDVLDAVNGTDGVIVALGTRNVLEPTTDRGNWGMKHIISSMHACKVNIVSVCLSCFLFWPQSMVPEKYAALHEHHMRMDEALKSSGLNYIAVQPPYILDEPSREVVVTVNPKQAPGFTISKWDLGTFLVDSLDEPEYYKADIGISNPPTIEDWQKGWKSGFINV